jgi:hypothetical protein
VTVQEKLRSGWPGPFVKVYVISNSFAFSASRRLKFSYKSILPCTAFPSALVSMLELAPPLLVLLLLRVGGLSRLNTRALNLRIPKKCGGGSVCWFENVIRFVILVRFGLLLKLEDVCPNSAAHNYELFMQLFEKFERKPVYISTQEDITYNLTCWGRPRSEVWFLSRLEKSDWTQGSVELFLFARRVKIVCCNLLLLL